MKRQNVNAIARKFFTGSMVTAVLFLSAQVNANTNPIQTKLAVENVDPTSTPSVNYVGTKNDNFFFHVNFKNTNNEFYTVLVLDNEGQELYRLSTKDKEFNKTFELATSTDIDKLSFVIKSNKINFKESFDINFTSGTTSFVAAAMK